jgi:ABC-2 type transport system permease protein
VNLLWLIIFLPCAISVCYATRFLFAASALFVTRADSLQYVWYQLYRLGTRPDSMFPLWIRYCILSFIPMAFIASVPADAVLHGPAPGLVLGAVAVMISVLALMRWYWNFGLRRYTSASS